MSVFAIGDEVFLRSYEDILAYHPNATKEKWRNRKKFEPFFVEQYTNPSNATIQTIYLRSTIDPTYVVIIEERLLSYWKIFDTEEEVEYIPITAPSPKSNEGFWPEDKEKLEKKEETFIHNTPGMYHTYNGPKMGWSRGKKEKEEKENESN